MKKIFVLHGWSYSTDKWQQFNAALNNYGFQVNQLNIPGLTEQTDKVWTLDNYVEWLKEIVDKEKTPISLIGHSNGGRIAIAFSARHPEKVKSLVLIDTAGIHHNEIPLRLKRLVFSTVAKVGKKLTTSDRLRALLYKVAGEKDYSEASSQMKQTMVNLISVDLLPRLKDIKASTLIIWGENDQSTPLSDGKKMHDLIQKSKFFVIKGARHSPQFTHSAEVVKIIHEHL